MDRKDKKNDTVDENLRRLTNDVTLSVNRNKDGTSQKEQVEQLMQAENDFKESILHLKQSTVIYQKFLNLIRQKNRNILSARPYFREKGTVFSKSITPAIKTADIETLKTFNINFQFIKFIYENWLGPFPKKAKQLYDNVEKYRTLLIENNMPLAINRAKLFFRKTPKAHLSLVDMVSISSMGLVSGVDKWSGPYSTVFRSVIIGRAVGNLIDSYSETILHFYPLDKKIIYRANSIRGRQGVEDMETLTRLVNESFEADRKEGKSAPKGDLTVSELNNLMSSISISSADTANEGTLTVYDYTISDDMDPEEVIGNREEKMIMLSTMKSLPLLHRKILKLKGLKF